MIYWGFGLIVVASILSVTALLEEPLQRHDGRPQGYRGKRRA